MTNLTIDALQSEDKALLTEITLPEDLFQRLVEVINAQAPEFSYGNLPTQLAIFPFATCEDKLTSAEFGGYVGVSATKVEPTK